MFAFEVHESRRNKQILKRVSFGGDGTLARAEEIRQILARALHSCDRLEVGLRGVREIDISFIMQSCAAHRTAELLGKGFTVDGTLSDAFNRHIDYARHLRRRGCLFSARRECRFWSSPASPAAAAGALPEAA